jgi:LmbE family N-acetylglucosaminyl deacetylase
MKVLVLAPHTDDGELGCGASTVKYIENGHDLYYAAFSICEDSVRKGYPKDILETEVKKATKVLGIKGTNLIIKKYPVRLFSKYRQNILDDLIILKNKIKPSLVFLPSSFDVHQDHNVIHQEGIRAFKNSSILGYEFMWNNYSFNSTSFIIINKKQLDKKIRALKKYESQKHRFYNSEESLKGLASYRGLQIGAKYAESFEVIRWVIR